MKVLLTLVLTISSIIAFAQPPNDNCSGAFTVVADGTCYGPGLPETTTVDASKGWVNSPGCMGNNDEVWFSFVATESQFEYTVTSGTLGGNIEFVLVSSSGPCSGLGLETTDCGASPLVGTVYGLVTGSTYYYTISSTGSAGTFTTCVETIEPIPVAGQDCPSAAVICDATSFTQGTFTGVGLVEEISLNSCFGSDERQSKWYTFTIGCDGTLGFDIIPTDLSNDYDFALWNSTSGCYSSGVIMPAPVACNWSGTTGATGAAYEYIVDPGPNPCTIAGATDCANGGGPNAGCQACTYTSSILNVTAGETYSLLIDNFGTSGTGFTFNFGGTAVIGPSADFTMVSPSCGAFDFTKTCQTVNSTFLWYFGDGTSSTLQNPSHTYTLSGTYIISLEVTDVLGCSKTTSQTVTVGIPPAPALTGAGTYCFGDPINLGATASSGGTLNWYDDAGLTNLVNTGTTYSPVLAVGGPYTYYVTETAGGCISAASSVVVNVVTADDPSFSYATTVYCQNGSDPTPTITGLAGGTFSSTAGLSINSGSGTIDVSASTAGAYTVTYLTAGPCPTSATFNLTISATEDPAFTYGAALYCQDAADPTPTITGTAGGTFSSTAGLSISSGTGLIDVSASTVGNYVVTYTTPGTCFASTTFNVEIAVVDDPTFSYAAASYCQNGVDPTPTATLGGGTYSSTAGLTINGGTGVIDLSASTAGVYTVTYLTAGTCPASTTFGITIVTVDDPSFTYAAAAYCQDASDPTPTITGTAGGTFSAGAGLSISSGTGLIDVSASTVGSYTVTYLTAGVCPSSTTFSVDIDAVDDPTFSYAAASYCQNGVDPTPTITTAGGTFSSAGGLSINAGTGVIDLSASTAGVYTVTYLTGGTCPASTTFGVTVVAVDDPSFTYGAAAYCQDASDPTPTITGTAGGTFSAGAGLSISAGTGLIDVSTSTVGSYTVTYLTGGTCPASTTFSVDIDAVDDPSFTYAAASYCQNGVDPTPTITGTAGGTFSAGAGLSIIAGTGVIDLSASTAGVYTVTYLTGGTCPASTTFGITIVLADDASFTYAAASYCQNGIDPTPTITGTAGGTFSAGAGLSISVGTGVIDLSASTAGVYTVTYLTGGACPASSTFGITVTAMDDASFSYSSGTFCLTSADPTPTITGTPGGTFTQTGGLVINAGSGLIDLGSSGIGAYTVTYTTSGACPTFTDFAVSITSSPDATFSYTGTPYCGGAGVATVTYGGGASGGDFTSTAGLTINIGTGEVDLATSTPGTYTVSNDIAAGGGCAAASATTSIEITSADDPTFSYASPSYCQDLANPTPTATTGGGTYTSTAGLSINAGTGEINLAASTAATYTITYTTAGTCPASTTFDVTLTTVDDASFTYASASFCMDGMDATPTLTGTPGGTYSSTAGLTINSVSGVIDVSTSTAATYTVTYTTAGTCPASATFDATIVVVDDPSFTYASVTYCQDESNPLPTATTGGGSYSSTVGLTINAGTGEIDLATSTAGVYTVTYLTGGTCPASSTFDVTLISVDNPAFSYSPITYCMNGTDATPVITGTPGGAFSSTGGLSINSVSGVVDVSASTAGPYTVTYLTGGTCPASSTFDITVNAVDDPSFTYSSATYCQNLANQLPTVTGTPGGTYSSTAGLSIIAGTGEINLASSTPGSYDVTYLTGGACPASTTFSITITAVDDASFSYSAATYCQDASDPTPTITGTAGGAFSSTAGLTINSVTGAIDVAASTVGVYSVTYLTTGTCPASNSVSVEIIGVDDPSFTYSSATYCQDLANQMPTVTGTAGGTYSSTAGLSIVAGTGEIDLASSTPGSYDVTYLTGGACPASTTFSITITAVDDASFNYSSVTYCQDGVDPIPTITTGGGSFVATAGLSIDGITGVVSLVGSTIGGPYTVTYTTAGTCPSSSTFDITVVGVDDPSFTYASASFCQNETNPSPTISGTSGGTFSSTAGLVINVGTGEIDLVSSTAGTYDITYLTGGTCPASGNFLVTVVAVDDASFTYNSNAFCIADPDPIATITGTLGGVFTMNPVGTIAGNNGAIDVSATGAGTYTIYYTTAGTCPAVDSTVITITSQLDATISLAGPYCSDDVVDTLISVTTGGNWFGVGVNSTTETFNPVAAGAGTWQIYYVLGGSCGASDTINVVVTQAQQAVMTGVGPYCSGDGSEFITVDTVGGTWSGTGVNSITGEFDPVVSGAGTWEIIYSPVGTCMNNDTIQVVVSQTPTAGAGVDVTIVSGESTPLTATGGGTYSWSPSSDLSCNTCFDPVASPLETTTYVVTVSSNGCSDTSSVVVTVTELEDNEFFVPNIFSPNGDGNNDVFIVEGSGLESFNLLVFNRWGEKVFESSDQAAGWDGTQNGERLNAAVFVYQIKYTDGNGEEQVVTGNITLVK